MSDQATYGIRIVGNNQVERGARAAERRLERVPRRVGETTRRIEREGRASLRRHAGSVVRTFGQVEQAGSQLFGGRSITAGITGRLGGITSAARATGTGLGEAAASGSMLSSAMGAVGVVAGATIGILAAAAVAAFKLSDGWAKGAASMARMAETIGVGTKELQEFNAAAERVGVDKDKATGTLGSLSQSLNDARYGRNNEALEVLRRLGVGMKTKADGNVDVGAMLPAIADAIARQNSSGRRTAARHLGIDLGALPIFAQGGKALSADMKDADTHAVMISDPEFDMAKRVVRKKAVAGQMTVDKAADRAGMHGAAASEYGYDLTIAGGQAILDGAADFRGTVERTFKPAAEKLERAANRVGQVLGDLSGKVGRFTGSQIRDFARRAMPLKAEAMRYGFSQAEATGIAANVMLESGGNHRSREKGGSGRGLIQWTDRARKRKFREITGVDVERSTRDQQWRFIKWETQNSERSGWRKALAQGQDGAAIAAGYARHVERPANKDRDSRERAAVAQAMGEVPVKVEVTVKGGGPGTHAKVTAGRGRNPAISHAMGG